MPVRRSYRLNVPLTPEVVDAFDELAAATGATRSAAVSGWLSESVQSVKLTAATFRRIAHDPHRIAGAVVAMADAAEQMTQKLLNDAAELRRAALDAQRPGQPGADLAPPSGNTGGKPSGNPNPQGAPE
jgi:hypothetical protein